MSPMRRWLGALFGLIAVTCSHGAAWAAQYHVYAGWVGVNFGTGYNVIYDTVAPLPPVYEVANYPASCTQGQCNLTNSSSYSGNADLGFLSLAAWTCPCNGATGSCMAGGGSKGELIFDVTFHSAPGAGPMQARMVFHAEGYGFIRFPNQWPLYDGGASLIVHAGPANLTAAQIEAGRWYVPGSSGTNTGTFVGVPAETTLVGDFCGPWFTLTPDVNGDVTQTIVLRADAGAAAEAPYGCVRSVFYGTSTNQGGIRLREGMPVFELPEGWTCESAEASIQDNIFQPGVNGAGEPAESRSWGQVKGMYR